MAAGGLRDPDRRSVARRGRRPWPPRRCCRALSEVFSWEDLGEMQVEIPSTWRRGKGVPGIVSRFVWPALRMPGYPEIIDAVLGTAFARTYTSLPWAGDRAHLFWFPRLPEFKLLSPATPSLQVRQTPARGNELRKIARLVNCEASGRESPSSFPPHLGGGSDASPFLGPLEMGLTALPSPQAPLAGSLSSSGCTTDLQMWVCGVQQRVSPLSFHP